LIDPANHFNWSSVPQKELNGRRFDVIVGKMLGGGSGHNGFQMHRGQKDDYDRWASYFDAPRGWGWDGLL
jgi:choline dehydrogenase-like flavoprotein